VNLHRWGGRRIRHPVFSVKHPQATLICNSSNLTGSRGCHHLGVHDASGAVNTILFAQHGWADTNRAMVRFGQTIASPRALVIAPNLGYIRSWLRIEPLIEQVERAAAEALAQHPEARLRIVGHSMGGLIWIELLTSTRNGWPGPIGWCWSAARSVEPTWRDTSIRSA